MGSCNILASFNLSILAILLILVVVAQGGAEQNGQQQKKKCTPSSCGNLVDNIKYPFRLKGNPRSNCGDSPFELSCEGNQTILYLFNARYYVKSISYDNHTIQVVDSVLQGHYCSSLPRHSYIYGNLYDSYGPYRLTPDYKNNVLVFVKCGIDAVKYSSLYYLDTASCINGSSHSKRAHNSSYVLLGKQMGDVMESCTVELMVSTALQAIDGSLTYHDIHRELLKGVELSWSHENPCHFRCA